MPSTPDGYAYTYEAVMPPQPVSVRDGYSFAYENVKIASVMVGASDGYAFAYEQVQMS